MTVFSIFIHKFLHLEFSLIEFIYIRLSSFVRSLSEFHWDRQMRFVVTAFSTDRQNAIFLYMRIRGPGYSVDTAANHMGLL